ncbi:MAG: Ldh family oxidoreductase [Nitratireductor sp.]|nr:Ldh family oxidoreductase [Nitratireductor sp.]
MPDKTTITLDEINSRSVAALRLHGASDRVAASVAAAITRAEAEGNVICGLYYLESYCRQLLSGRVNGTVEPVISRPRPGSVLADARFGFAQPAFARALPVTMEAARSNGTVSLAIAHSHTCTSLGYFTAQFAEAGLLAIGFTNASAVVAPPGGNRPVLGTNPVAMSVPARNGGMAFGFDHSTSAVALGKITMAAAAGEAIPPGWAVDSDGKPTTVPAAALKGALVSAGGYKGYSFGLMAEVMASALTGSVGSLDVKALKAPEGQPHDLGQTYLVIDPSTFAGDGFFDRIEALARAVAAQDGARLPGTRRIEARTAQIDASLWHNTVALSEKRAALGN